MKVARNNQSAHRVQSHLPVVADWVAPFEIADEYQAVELEVREAYSAEFFSQHRFDE